MIPDDPKRPPARFSAHRSPADDDADPAGELAAIDEPGSSVQAGHTGTESPDDVEDGLAADEDDPDEEDPDDRAQEAFDDLDPRRTD